MLFLVLIYATFISLGLPDVLLGTAWPEMHVDLGVALDAAGPLSMMISGMTIASGLMSGMVLRRFGTGRVVAISTLLTAVAMFGFAWSPMYLWLYVFAIPLGLGAGAIDTGVNDYVAEHYSVRHMNWLHGMWGVGAMVGPMLISLAIARGGWRDGYRWVGAVQLVLAGVLLTCIPAWGRRSNSAQIAARERPEATLRGAVAVRGVPLAMLAFTLYCAAEMALSLWGASYLTQLRGMDSATAAIWVSVYFGGITAGRFLSGLVSARIGGPGILRLGEGLALLGAALIALPLSPVGCAAGMLLFGLGLAPLFPTMLHLTPRRFDDRYAARIISLQISAAYVGSTFLPPVIGWVSNVTGLGILPYVLIACVALMAVCCERIDKKRV